MELRLACGRSLRGRSRRPATMGERCPAARAADNDGAMPLAPGFVPPCIPTRTAEPPAGPDWVHEIKHDGYRLQVGREGDVVRLFTRRGYDWSARVSGDRRNRDAAPGDVVHARWRRTARR
jgi:ATP-dependent DNA ligase